MKRFTATWITAAAATVVLALPAAGAAQTPPPTTPPATAQPPATPAATPQDHSAHQGAPQEHLRQASAALAEVKTATLPAKAKTHVAEIKRRLAALERTTAASDKASATGQANRSAKAKTAANWGTEVAAIDKALTTLLGPAETTGTPAATGTTGTTPAARNKAAAAITLDAEARASLTEVRTHLTAFATAMAGGKTDTEAMPTAAADTTAQSTTSSASSSAETQTPAAQPPTTQPATPPSHPTSAPQAPASPSTSANEEEARRHLTEARNTLSALTQLPAAAQLSGEARTQVAQLISNFNELITTQSQWRDSYTKVSATLTAMLGPDPTASDPTNASGTAGAVGTSGSATAPAAIDPAVREKLVELRRNLSAFEKAATGGASATTTPADAAATTTPATTPATTTPATTPATTPPATSEPTAPATSGTTGTMDTQSTAGNADVMKHVTAIEALLKMQDDSGGLTLTKAQVEELRTHWAAMRLALGKK